MPVATRSPASLRPSQVKVDLPLPLNPLLMVRTSTPARLNALMLTVPGLTTVTSMDSLPPRAGQKGLG